MPPEPSPFAFSQIAEMNSTPADIPIPELENLRRGLAPAFAPTQQLTGQEETDRALAKMRDMQSHLVMANQVAQRPPQPTKTTIKTDPDGNKHISIEGPAELAEYYGKAGQFYQQAMGGMQQEMERLAKQEAQARSQPWAQLATALSANLAQAKDMPGWVQAAGRTAAQLNPTADQLRNQRMLLAERGAGLAEKGLALGLHQQQIAEQRAERQQTKGTQEENQLEDNYRQVQQKIESEVTTNKRVTPEQEQALRVVGAQMKRTPQRIEADLARMRAGATASAEALAEERKFKTEEARTLAKEAEKRANAAQTSQDRRQAQGQIVTALIPLYKEASWKPADQDILQDMGRLDQTFDSFLKTHGAAGGPIAGRAAKLMAAFGDPNAQRLMRDESQVVIDAMKSSGLSFARTSEKEMELISKSLVKATNNPKVALETAARYQKWGDDVRKRFLQERYAGQYAVVAPYMPTTPLVTGEARPDWQKVQETHRASIAKPGTLEQKVLNLPKLMSEVAGESGLMKTPAERPTAINKETGEVREWDGKAWVKKQ